MNSSLSSLLLAAFLFVSLAGTRQASAEPTIAFSREGAIYTASADGKNVKKICAGADPSISPDGRYVVYTKSTERTPPPKKGADDSSDTASFTRALWLHDLTNGQEKTIPTGKAQQVYGAQWSPDGQWIAFNVLVKCWQAAVVKPDGAEFRVLTEKMDAKDDNDWFLAGWNYQQQEVLVQDLTSLAQVSPAGSVTWKRPVKDVIGADSSGSDMRCTISADGKLVVATHQVVKDEFQNLDGPSSYLVMVQMPGGKVQRVTPKKFDAATPWLDPAGAFILFRGFGEKDVVPLKDPGNIRLKLRIYRYDIATQKLMPLIEDAETPSQSTK